MAPSTRRPRGPEPTGEQTAGASVKDRWEDALASGRAELKARSEQSAPRRENHASCLQSGVRLVPLKEAPVPRAQPQGSACPMRAANRAAPRRAAASSDFADTWRGHGRVELARPHERARRTETAGRRGVVLRVAGAGPPPRRSKPVGKAPPRGSDRPKSLNGRHRPRQARRGPRPKSRGRRDETRPSRRRTERAPRPLARSSRDPKPPLNLPRCRRRMDILATHETRRNTQAMRLPTGRPGQQAGPTLARQPTNGPCPPGWPVRRRRPLSWLSAWRRHPVMVVDKRFLRCRHHDRTLDRRRPNRPARTASGSGSRRLTAPGLASTAQHLAHWRSS